ncbi:MAG: hypothetical protein JWM11_6979 [Planctomycetaceae bacterium]|nr:hypothetical protein [Planctomycetaceae bacterium]
MRRITLFISILFGLASGVSAAGRSAAATSEFLVPFLDDQVVFVARINVAKVDLDRFLNLEDVVTGSGRRSIQRLKPIANDLQKRFLAAGGTEIYLIYSVTSDKSGPLFLIAPLSKNSQQADLAKILGEQFGRGTEVDSIRIGEALVVGNRHIGRRFDAQRSKPNSRPEFAAGLVSAGDAALQVVFSPSKDQRRVLAELLPALPGELGSVTVAELLKAIAWIALTVDVSDQPRGRFIAETMSPQDATLASDFLSKGLKFVAGIKTLPKSLQDALISGKLNSRTDGNQITMSLGAENQGVGSLPAMLVDMTGEWWEELCRVHIRNNLKQLALAMHNFNDAHGQRFPPPASEATDGKPRLSWRVRILPYLDQVKLYERFHQDEPWNSEHNLQLLKEIPDVYKTLDQERDSGQTTFLIPTNPGMMGGDPIGINSRDVKDGTSNSIMILQVDQARAVPWTKPQDFEVDLKEPWKGVISADGSGTWSVFIDGSVRYLSRKNDAENLLKYLTLSGGEITN